MPPHEELGDTKCLRGPRAGGRRFNPLPCSSPPFTKSLSIALRPPPGLSIYYKSEEFSLTPFSLSSIAAPGTVISFIYPKTFSQLAISPTWIPEIRGSANWKCQKLKNSLYILRFP